VVAQNPTPQTLLAAMRHFTPDVAQEYVARIKWPAGPCCPKCGSVRIGTIKSRGRYQCRERECRHQFSLIADTIFAGTHLRLDQWIAGVWLLCNCKNGVSSCELARAIGCKQQSAWHLIHRVRYILQQELTEKYGRSCGVVEADSTFIGGALKWMSYQRQQRARERLRFGKAIVHAIKDRNAGTVRAQVPESGRRFTQKFIEANVAPGALLCTDKGSEYDWADGTWYHRQAVNHKALEYVRGMVHVNGLECFFNCLRRSLKGTYIRATPEHLAAYLDEAVFRFNNRKETDWERFDRAMHLIVGKRLTYSELTDGAVR
jgi:hypothetical protein